MKQSIHPGTNHSTKRLARRACQILCLASFLLLLSRSSLVLTYARKGLSLWFSSVLPVLLPFIVLSKFWIYFGIPGALSRVLEKIAGDVPDALRTLPVLGIGLCCGFPVGAVFLTWYYENGLLEKRTAEVLLPTASFVSPMFLSGYVRPLLSCTSREWQVFLLALYLPVFLSAAFLLGRETRRAKKKAGKSARLSAVRTGPKMERGVRAIWLSSLEIIATIGVYMMLFSILFGLILHSLPACRALYPALSSLEVTSGAALLAQSGLPHFLKYLGIALAVAFGGFCTMAQVYAIVADAGLSLGPYLAEKCIAAAMTGLLLLLFYSSSAALSKSSLLLPPL